jgi:ubiquitin-protein ligase E3 A
MDDFKRFREKVFALCNFPFVLTVTTKANILKLESSVLMREKLQVRKLNENEVMSGEDGN